ncbi:MAG: DUF2283 domain-containing protein, partial [Candidatus Liptonbacteria bacterium]
VDTIADAAYITLRKDIVERTVPQDKDWLFDLDKKGQIIGIEILNYSKNAIMHSTVPSLDVFKNSKAAA